MTLMINFVDQINAANHYAKPPTNKTLLSSSSFACFRQLGQYSKT